MRERVRELIEEMIRGELDAVLSRPRYGRRAKNVAGEEIGGVAGHRHGSRAKAAVDVRGEPKEISSAFKQLIADAQCHLSPGTLCWIVIPHLGEKPVAVHEKCEILPNNQSVVFLLARDTRPQPNRLRLQKLFDLTGAETEVALSIACGHTLLEIAQSRNLSRTTIRSHVASLFAKTDTRRQSELMALLMNMAVLP